MVFGRLFQRKKVKEVELAEKPVTEAQLERELVELQQAQAPPKEVKVIPEEKLADVLNEYTAEEIEEVIVQLTNAGTGKSEIGLILRDQYGIPSLKRLMGKTVSEVLREKKLAEELPEDLLNLIKKTVNVLGHMQKNRKDFSAKRGYQLTVAKINKLAKYYKRKKILPADWHYSDERARLLVK